MDAVRDAAAALQNAKRVVVKIGSALVTDADGAPARGWLAGVGEDIAAMAKRGQSVLIVSSGAVALGRRRLGLKGALRLDEKQAAAAAGQIRLAHAYEEALAPFGLPLAQVLLTLDDTENRRRYLNARATFETLLANGAVPLVNENDTVTTAEIRYGDNDRLAAHAAQMAGADCLVLLSDIDGLYDADPRRNAGATFLPRVDDITPAIEAMAGAANAAAAVGSGGMATKIEAAKIAVGAGCGVLIAKGDAARPLSAIENGARCTWFPPKGTPAQARKAWIAGRLKPAGAVTIDEGAAKALAKGGSLLAAGVTAVDGAFSKGDAVEVRGPDGARLGQGLIGYDAADAGAILGAKSAEIEARLGYAGPAALIHRDDLALFAKEEA